MTDDRIVEYLRSRGRAEPPTSLLPWVLAAVGEAPEPRSRFHAIFSPLIAAGALAVVVALVLMIGYGRDIGPAPTPGGTPPATVPPSASEAAVTLDELEAEVGAATERLTDADGVVGRHSFTIGKYLASVSWFDWRPGGDQVLVTRTDVDVSAPWWTDPVGEPLTVGERIDERISVIAGGHYYVSREEGWIAPIEAPRGPLTWALGMLSGEIPPVPTGSIGDDPVVTRSVSLTGDVLWSVEIAAADGRSIAEWHISPEGFLAAYTIRGDGLALDPVPDVGVAESVAQITFEPVADPAPIAEPDLEALPDPAAVGYPADMPLVPPAASLDEVEQVEACEHPSGRYRVTLPDGWWTNRDSGDQASQWEACELFGPEPFDVRPADASTWPSGVALSISWIDDGCIGSFLALLSSEETTVDGQAASVQEYAWSTSTDDPPGLYQYVIDLSEPDTPCEVSGQFIMASTSVGMTGDYDENTAFLDQVMESMTISRP